MTSQSNCPVCGTRADGNVDVVYCRNRDHYGICDSCRVIWCISSSPFSPQRDHAGNVGTGLVSKLGLYRDVTGIELSAVCN